MTCLAALAVLSCNLAINIGKYSNHLNSYEGYNERNHEFVALTYKRVTVGKFMNSYYEPTKFVSYQWEFNHSSWVSTYVAGALVHGYSRAENMVVPLAGIRIGRTIQFEAEWAFMAVTHGIRYQF